MMQDIAWMAGTLMEVVLLLSSLEGHPAVLGNISEEARHLGLGVALIVVLMATGLGTAKPEIGRTSVTAVGREAT